MPGLIRDLASLTIVLAAVIAIAAFVRKRGPLTGAWKLTATGRAGRRMAILEKLPLTVHQTVFLIRLDQEDILIAASQTGCSILQTGRSKERE